MAYGHRACQGRSPRRRVALLAALLLLPGCETLTRMDYLDQFFDPAGYAARHEARLSPVSRPTAPPHAARPDAMPDRQGPAPASPEAAPPTPPTDQPTVQASGAPDGDRDQWVRGTVRMHPWLALNWAQLTAAQQQQIEGRLGGGGAEGRPAAAWDTMGLDDRATLAFGSSAMAGAANRDGDYAARRR